MNTADTFPGHVDLKDPAPFLEYLEHLWREVQAGRRLRSGIAVEVASPHATHVGGFLRTPIGEGEVARVLAGCGAAGWQVVVYVDLQRAIRRVRELCTP